jgi:hypothetical protein
MIISRLVDGVRPNYGVLHAKIANATIFWIGRVDKP